MVFFVTSGVAFVSKMLGWSTRSSVGNGMGCFSRVVVLADCLLNGVDASSGVGAASGLPGADDMTSESVSASVQDPSLVLERVQILFMLDMIAVLEPVHWKHTIKHKAIIDLQWCTI